MYKRKQGQTTRWITFVTLTTLWLYAAYRCFFSFPDWKWAETVYLYSVKIPLVEIPTPDITSKLLISIGVGVLLSFISAYMCFWGNRTSDFLIDTESEMRKVSWPTLKEVLKSSVVVIIAIIILAVYLYVVDIGLDSFFNFLF